MLEPYEMVSTSLNTAEIQEREIATIRASGQQGSSLSQTGTTRLIVRPLIVNNASDPEAGVKITLIYQRKRASGEWEGVEAINLNTLRSGEGVRLSLDSRATLRLYEELQNLYAIHGSGGVRYGETRLVVGREDEIIRADPERARVINDLLAREYPTDIWDALVAANPDLVSTLSWSRIRAERLNILEVFRDSIGDEAKGELWWQDFFHKNKWIFGYGLNYQILREVQAQPHYGGTQVDRSGAQRGDFLARTDGEVSFTVLVEIKRPVTPLLHREYRNGAWSISEEVAGGVAQLQTNCDTWEIEGSRTDSNREEVEIQEGALTVQPKGILIVGNAATLATRVKKKSFQLYRRNLHNPEIITFDELLARAVYIIDHLGETAEDNI